MQTGGGAWIAGEKDFFVGIFAIWGSGFFLQGLEKDCAKKRWYLFFSGVAFGLGIGLRPHQILIPLCTYLCFFNELRKIRFGLFITALGLAMPWAGCLAWLWINGAVAEYYRFVSQFLLPTYAFFYNNSLERLLQNMLSLFGPVLIVFLAGTIPSLHLRRQQQAAIVGLFAGIFGYVIQSKWWWYQLSPAIPYLAVCATFAIHRLDLMVCRNQKTVALLIVGTFAAMVGPYGHMSLDRTRPFNESRTYEIASELNKFDLTNARVQPMEYTIGALNALLFLRILPATRFLYDIYFFNFGPNSFRLQSRAEFIDAISENPPDFFVFSESSYIFGFNRMNQFLQLRQFLDKNYYVCSIRPTFWIYASAKKSMGHLCESAADFHHDFFHNTVTTRSEHPLLIDDPA